MEAATPLRQPHVRTVGDRVAVGARVLDREQAGANAEFVKTEFERTAAELNTQFTERARAVAEYFNERVEQVFGPDNGQLAKELEKLFSDGSSVSVQNRVRELVADTMTRSREDLMKQFSSADGANPL